MARRSSTQRFGTPKRENHDSAPFYATKLYQSGGPAVAVNLDQPAPEEAASVPENFLDQVVVQDSRQMAGLPDACVHLMVTSPPYNVGKEYDADLSLDEYRELLRQVFQETYRVLVPGGRVCVNVANLGRKPYIPLHAYLTLDMLEIGFLMRGEVIWDKAASAGGSCAWGSWMSASNPTLRDVHEYLLIFSKGSFKRGAAGKESTVERDEFLEMTKSIWTFPAESAKRVGHPAPFPTELPRRVIQLYTFAGDVVLDPFCGSGSTCVAAALTRRHFVGFDIDPEYAATARRRVAAARQAAGQSQLPL